MFNETLAELEKAKRERKGDPILIYDTGMIYAAQGKRAEALQIIKDLEGISGASLSQAHLIAKIYATLNEKEMALSWLERGLATGAIGPFYKDGASVGFNSRRPALRGACPENICFPLTRLATRDEREKFLRRAKASQCFGKSR